MKKIISIFLTICLTVIPLNAYAIDSTDSEYSTDNQTVVATDIIAQVFVRTLGQFYSPYGELYC